MFEKDCQSGAEISGDDEIILRALCRAATSTQRSIGCLANTYDLAVVVSVQFWQAVLSFIKLFFKINARENRNTSDDEIVLYLEA